LSASGGFKTPYLARAYENEPRLQTREKQTQPVAAKPPCRAEVLHEAGMAKPDQTQPVAAKPPCRGEVLHEAGMAKPDQTQPVAAKPPCPGKVEAKRRSPRVSFSKSSSRGPNESAFYPPSVWRAGGL